jgi:hypothetical protein
MRAYTVRLLVVLAAVVPSAVACGGSGSDDSSSSGRSSGATNTVTVQPSSTSPDVARFTAQVGAACLQARRNAPKRAPRGTAGLAQYAQAQALAAQQAAAALARVRAPRSLAAVLATLRQGYARLLPVYARAVEAGQTKDTAALRRARRSLQHAEGAASRAAVAAGVPACAPRRAAAAG